MKKMLLSVSLLVMTGLSALAQTGSQIINGQINLDNNWSNLHASVGTIGGDVVVQGAAGGNLVDITTMNNTKVLNSQIVGSPASIGSNVTLGANNVLGSVGVQNQVLCNGASISTDPILTSVKSNQECHAADPYAQVNATAVNIGGDMVVQNSALGNSFEADSNAPNMPIMTHQINTSASVANTTVGAVNVGGSVGITSSAIGNTAQIIHYGTP